MALEDPQRRFFSTAQIAAYCSVSTDGVLRWIRSGELPAFTTPGGHYRIRAEEFRDFLQRFDIPVDESFFRPPGPDRTVVLIGKHDGAARAVRSALVELDGSIALVRAGNGYEASLQIGRLEPDLIVFDPTALLTEGAPICRALRRDDIASRTPVLGLTSPEVRATRHDIERAGADCCLVAPATARRIRSSLARMLGLGVASPETGSDGGR